MKRILQLILLLPSFAMAQYTGLQFDGGGDYIQTGFNGISGSGSRTVQLWYRGTSSSSQMFFVDMGVTSGGNGARFSLKMNSSSNVARIEIGGGGLNGSANIANNFWHHITVVYDAAASSNKYKLYVDGVLDVQGDIAIALNTPATSANPLTIGIRTDLNSSTDLFGGLDDVRIWSVPLSAAEIAANYNQELCGTPAGLAAYFKMDEGIATSNNTAITSLIDEVNPTNSNPISGFTMTGNSSNYTTHILNIVNNTSTQTVSYCGDYVWSQNGATYTTTGMYYDTVTISAGCDSVYTLDLTITPIPPTTVAASSCTDYVWSQNGVSYSASGMYNDTLTSSAGCDSIVILDLTITPIAPTIVTASGCGNYFWSQNGMIYSTSGMYNDTILTSTGCDSIIMLDLTVNSSTSSTVVVSSCSDYLWAQNGVTYTNSGSYFDTIPNASGCDSVVELDLTIGSVSMSTVSINACDSYLWPFNNQTYTTSGIYSDTIFTSTGCDSIIELTLTLFTEQNTITDNGNGTLTADFIAAVVTYQWIDCSDNSPISGETNQTFTPTTNGNYAVVTSSSSCTDTSDCFSVSNVGIEELKTSDFKVYPNPTQGKFTVESSNNQLIKEVFIRDVQGKVIEFKIVNQSSLSSDLSLLEAGVYYVTVISENNQSLNYRIVKK